MMTLPNDLSFKALAIQIIAHIPNIRRPDTYVEEIKKGLKAANPLEVDVPNDVDSSALFQVIPPQEKKKKKKCCIAN